MYIFFVDQIKLDEPKIWNRNPINQSKEKEIKEYIEKKKMLLKNK